MKKVMLGMSGGVDSSVAGAVLLEQGYSVTGVTLLLNDGAEKILEDARGVAKHLGIKHVVLDLKKEFNQKVINYFVSEYIKGRTPNPCAMCNAKIKFGFMLEYALQNGYSHVATGHYAVNLYSEARKAWLLKKSESSKDQSYFLYGLTQHQLSHAIFPLAHYEKSKIREIALLHNIPTAHKKDSQDICFIKEETYAQFIEKYTGNKFSEGKFLSANGKELGIHKGISNYTIGQRKHLGVALGRPMYVNEINAKENTVILGSLEEGVTDSLTVGEVNLIAKDFLPPGTKAWVKIRSAAKPVLCTLCSLEGGDVQVDFTCGKYFKAPGQCAVFYDDEGFVIGGGIIK